jgi:hypothetical protein
MFFQGKAVVKEKTSGSLLLWTGSMPLITSERLI